MEQEDKESRRNTITKICILIPVLIGSAYYMFFHDPGKAPKKIGLPNNEILINMDLMGYKDVVLGPKVEMLGGNIGPCLTFNATYKGDGVKGGYCTPKYEINKWGPVVMSREVANLPEVINGSYQK